MREEIDQDVANYQVFTFGTIPDRPRWARLLMRVHRMLSVIFVQTWLPVLSYRLRRWCQRQGIPLLPWFFEAFNRAVFRVQIGPNVEIGPGLMLPHGYVVIDGFVRIGRNCQINPWVTIGLNNSRRLLFTVKGPTIGDNVYIGTGAKVLGPVIIGDNARIGANAVVLHDVPPDTTVVGVPARPIPAKTAAKGSSDD